MRKVPGDGERVHGELIGPTDGRYSMRTRHGQRA